MTRGQPKKKIGRKTINISLYPIDLKSLDRFCRRHSFSRSQAIRFLLRQPGDENRTDVASLLSPIPPASYTERRKTLVPLDASPDGEDDKEV